MFWLPGQSKESWARTIDRAVDLAPNHLSLYLLELYPNAPLKETMARQAWAQAPDDDAADMYLAALDSLDREGFEQYEISNVARPGHASRHNVKYWQGGQWRGFGCGAHSTLAGRRWKNVAATADYVDRINRSDTVALDTQTLSATDQLEEALFTGLRLTAGVNGRNILRTYGVDPWQQYGEALTPYLESGLLWKRGEEFGLTRSGMLLANEIMTTFV